MPSERSIAGDIVSPFDLAAEQDPANVERDVQTVPMGERAGVRVEHREGAPVDPFAQRLTDSVIYDPGSTPVHVHYRSTD